MASPSSNTINQGSEEYPYPSHVTTSSFLSIKLSGKTNYDIWHRQMMCLLKSHDMFGFIDDTFKNPKLVYTPFEMKRSKAIKDKYRKWERSDMLVQGWIFGSLTEDVMHAIAIVDPVTAKDVWEKLMNAYGTPAPINIEIHMTEVDEDDDRNGAKDENRAVDLSDLIMQGKWDDAHELIKKQPNMGTDIFLPLKAIVRNKDAHFSGTKYNFYQRLIYLHVPTDTENNGLGKFVSRVLKVAIRFVSHIKHLHKDKVKHNQARMVLKHICKEADKAACLYNGYEQIMMTETIVEAVEKDIPEPIEEIIKTYPMASSIRHNGYNITQLAIINRCEKIYSSLVSTNAYESCYNDNKNNLWHMAGQLAPIEKLNLVSGAALQMQRELQWFQEVKKLLDPIEINEKNSNQETPIMVFRREHRELRKEGEEWMKKTADSYTITAALIITIVFAAAITVPGGNNGDTGNAIYATKPGFIIFAISDAISLFTSTTSLLLFLSILTARYRDEDFLYRLPTTLILGLMMLFLSVTSMMIAFSATLYLMFGHERAWILYPIGALTCLPIASFVTLQFPLLLELTSSLYYPRIFPKKAHQKHHQWTRLAALYRFISCRVMSKQSVGDEEV